MTLWDFIVAHPFLAIGVGVFVLMAISQIGDAAAKFRGKD